LVFEAVSERGAGHGGMIAQPGAGVLGRQ
jgi:hypothetical protein